MIHRHVFHNDRVQPIDQVRLSPGQMGLMNGWGLFTTIRVTEGVPFAFERHWNRLARDAARTHCPFHFDADKVRGQLGEVLSANAVKEGCARIYVIYNQPGFWRSDEQFPEADLVMYSSDLPPHRDEVRLGLREHGRHASSPLAGVKVTSWLGNVWNLYEAQQRGCDEVVLLNERGEVAECTAANIFCVEGGRVVTSPLSSGCLEGVTRGIVIELGPRADVPVHERTLYPEDLFSADEVFISSTNRNVVAVREITGQKVGGESNPVMQKFEKVFEGYVREYVEAHTTAAVRR